MNKIYKVIWNKTRGMYMVVSELTKGQSKDGRGAVGRKKVAQTAAALALFFSVVSAGGTAWAADTATVTDKNNVEQTVYTKEGTDSQIEAAKKYTYRKAAELDQKLTDQKTSTALHVSKDGNLIVGTKENQTVKDVKIRGQLTSGSISTGNITSTGDVSVAGKVEAEAVYDDTTKTGNYVVQTNSVGSNLSALDTQVKANADATTAEAATREAADTAINNKLAQDKTDTALHVSKDGNLIVGTKENQTVKDVKIRGQLTSGSISTGNITSTGDVSVAGKVEAEAVYDDTTKTGNYVVQTNSVGSNLSALDTQVKSNADAITAETTAREAADTALTNRIAAEEVDRAEADTKLQEAIDTEARQRKYSVTNLENADKQLQANIDVEAAAREAADNALDTRTSDLEAKTEAITYDKDSKTVMVDGKLTATEGITDGTTQDGQYVKPDNYVGQNLNALDQGLQAETTAREAADTAEAEARQAADTKLQENIDAEAATRAAEDQKLNKKITAEKKSRIAADTKLVEAVNSGLSLSDDNVLQKNTTTIDAKGNVTTTKTDANEMILNKGKDNQITLNEKGIKVGTNSTVIDKDGVYTGGDTFDAAKAAMSSDGQIKGANGKFTVDASGNASVTSLDAGTGTIQTKGDLYAKDATFSGDITAKDATLSGDLSAKDGTFSGDLSAKDGTFSGDVSAKDVTATGTLQGAEVTDGTATMQNGNLTGVKNLSAETITTSGDATIGGDLTVKGKLNVDEIDLTKSGIVGDNNVTASTKVAAGEITSYKKATSTKDGSEKESAIDYDENGTSTWAKSTDADGNWKKSTLTVEGSDVTSKVIDSEKNSNLATQTSTQSQSTLTDADKNTNTATQSAAESSSVLSDKDGNNTSSFRQRIDQILQEIKSANGSTSVEQTDVNITNTAKNGTITNDAQNLVNKASDSITSQIGDGSAVKSVMDANGIANTATGGTISNSAADVINTGTNSVINQVGDNQVAVKTDSVKAAYGSDTSTTWDAKGITNTTSGDISNSAANISNTTTGNMTNTVGGNLIDTIMGTSTTTVTGKVTEDYKSDLSTKVGGDETHAVTGNQTTTVSGNRTVNVKGTETENFNALETNVKTDQKTSVGGNQTTIVTGNQTNTVSGSKTETVKGSVTEKYGSQATTVDGDQSTNIGGNQTTVVAKDQTNTVSGNKTETVKGAVNETYGSQTTKVNGDQSTTVAGKQTNSITGDQVNTIGGSQTTTVTGDSSLSAKNITHTATVKLSNNAAEIENVATTSITSKIGNDVSSTMSTTSIVDKVGKTTVTTTDGLTKLTNEDGTHKTEMDYAEVMKDLGVRGSATIDQKLTVKGDSDLQGNATVGKDLEVKGNTKLDGTLEVAGKSTFKDDVTMEKNLDVKGITTTDKLVVNNGATVTGGTTTDTLHVTSTSTFDGMATFKDAVSMEKDLSVGGNATVAGDVSAKSYKVADKTYIDQNGLNANSQKVTNVADGTIAEGSKDAVNGGQLHATNQRVSTVENRMDRVETRVDNLDNRIDKVGASAAAMANLHPMDFDEDSKVSVAAAVGNYRSETAGALGVFYRPTDRVMMNVSTSFGNGENMIGGGVSFKLGKSSKRLEKAEATNAALVKQVTNLQNRLDALLGVLNPNLSKAFPDVPANHWAYEAVSRLAGNDIIQGYEDGKYHGERTMTRYEMAEIIYNALSKGAKAEAKLVEEFRPELQARAAQRKA